jgi:hypothetical protein
MQDGKAALARQLVKASLLGVGMALSLVCEGR